MTERWLTARELATTLNVSPRTIGRWTAQGAIPSVVWAKRTRRYRLSEVEGAVRRVTAASK